MKRGFDVAVAMTVLTLGLPALILIAALVALTMGRPVFFRQERPGLDGRPFTLVKFRTMRDGASSDAERLTKVGRLLRATSLDELPQLWNVATGEMTLVGPRPLLPEYLPLYSIRQAKRHEVRPGITGLAQVSGRNAVTWEQRLETDVVYVENRSLRLDLWILFRTVAQVVARADVSPEDRVTMAHFTGSDEPIESESSDAA
ncbi:MAG: sugar transferase [Actinomycetota bacterium]